MRWGNCANVAAGIVSPEIEVQNCDKVNKPVCLLLCLIWFSCQTHFFSMRCQGCQNRSERPFAFVWVLASQCSELRKRKWSLASILTSLISQKCKERKYVKYVSNWHTKSDNRSFRQERPTRRSKRGEQSQTLQVLFLAHNKSECLLIF